MRVPVVAALLALALFACEATPPVATDPDPASTTTAVPESTTTSTEGVTSTTSGPISTSTTSPQVDVEFRSGEVFGPSEFEVDVGETVDLWVLSDVDDEIHVHGYDLFIDLKAGEPHHLTFVADVPGIFEVEVHTGHTKLFDLEVSG